MPRTVTEFGVILLLILLSGVFAMSEIAIVSARKIRLEKLARDGNKGAAAALELANSPHKFLATVQIGMTITAMLTGVFGGETIAAALTRFLDQFPTWKPYAHTIGFWAVVVIISYLTLILGELGPKRIALNRAERIACMVGPPMRWLSVVAAPIVRFLGASTDLLLRALGIKQSHEPPITTDEIKFLVEQGANAGVIDHSEEGMVKSVLRLGSKKVTALMTPRPRLVWIDINETQEKLVSVLTSSPPTRLLVGEGSLDHLHGYVFTRHLLSQPAFSTKMDIMSCLRQPLYVPKNRTGLQVLDMFKDSHTHVAVVLDEYGSVLGLVTMTDLLKAIVGDVTTYEEGPREKRVVQRTDGSWFLDGMLPVDRLKEVIGVEKLPGEDKGRYQTLAGFIMHQVGHVPDVFEHCEWGDYVFHVAGMTGRRIEKVRVFRVCKEVVIAGPADLNGDADDLES